MIFMLTYACLCASGPQEYCQYDVFNPRCPKGKVIMVTTAKFGRMRVGKCVPLDLGKGNLVCGSNL